MVSLSSVAAAGPARYFSPRHLTHSEATLCSNLPPKSDELTGALAPSLDTAVPIVLPQISSPDFSRSMASYDVASNMSPALGGGEHLILPGTLPVPGEDPGDRQEEPQVPGSPSTSPLLDST